MSTFHVAKRVQDRRSSEGVPPAVTRICGIPSLPEAERHSRASLRCVTVDGALTLVLFVFLIMAIGLNGPFYFVRSDQEERESQWDRKKHPNFVPLT